MLKYNCHTHTSFCDGKNTAEEMVAAAIEKGFTSLGFSGHSPLSFENEWAMSEESVGEYIREINRLKLKYKKEIDILCGIELDRDYAHCKPEDFDYVIGSVHQFFKDGREYPIDLSEEMLKKACDEVFDGNVIRMCKAYYDSLGEFICRIKPQVVGHFDLLTKFNRISGFIPENNEEYRAAALNTVDKILGCCPDILFEVNTGAMYRVGNTRPYPAPFIMEHLRKKAGKLTITSDAHKTDALDFGFDTASEYCRSFGFESFYALTGDGIKEIAL